MNRSNIAQESLTDAGVIGNSRLTSVNGMVLLVLLAVEGFTILGVRQMITLHIYLGILLVGPVLLKCGSTMYRFARYYTGVGAYVRKGPPALVLRITGPVVVLTSVTVLGTGIALVFTGPQHPQPWLTLHKASFILWVGAMTIHVLGHVVEASRTAWRELQRSSGRAVRQRRLRTTAITLSLLVGVGLATGLMPSAHAWTNGRLEHTGNK
jgi:hypothetical protein